MKLVVMLLVISVSKEVIYHCSALPIKANPPYAIYAKEGESTLFHCQLFARSGGNISLHWGFNFSHGLQELKEEDGKPMMKQDGLLLMLNVSQSDQGIYACWLRNGSGNRQYAWFNLSVSNGECHREEDVHPVMTNKGQSVIINCKPSRFPLSNFSCTWQKDCEPEIISTKNDMRLNSAEKDAGTYTSMMSFWYEGHVYYMSMTKELVIKDVPQLLTPEIISPRADEVVEVDLGKPALITCIVVLNSEHDFMELHWINGTMPISMNENLPVFHNSTTEKQQNMKYHMISSLVFRNVSKEYLNATYTCKLESPLSKYINVSVTLTLKEHSKNVQPHLLLLGIVAISAVLAVAVTVVYKKLKIDIILFLRDLMGSRFSVTDGRKFDAYIMHYSTSNEEALSEEETRLLLRILEGTYGYRLCIYDRDVLPGGAVANVVLEHIQQSRRLVLLPSTLGTEQYGLLSGLHAALVERQTQLLLVQREPRGGPDSLPEPLRLLARSGGTATWRGAQSARHSSHFWKELRYHMPAGMPRYGKEELPLL